MTGSVTVTFAQPLRVDTAAGKTRTISGLAVPFGVPSAPSFLDGERYQFDGPPANAADLVELVRGHDDDHVVGRLAQPFEQTAEGLTATARVFDSTRGADVLVDASEGVLAGFSVSADITEFETDQASGVRTVTAWNARHLGVVRRPAFEAAAGLTVAASAHTQERTPPMTTTTAPPDVVQLPTVAELAAQVTEHVQAQLQATHRTHPLAQFSTLGDYVYAVGHAQPEQARELQAAFAIADQVTADNPGVIPPGWRTDVKMVLDARRPAINGTGGPIGLPDAGMDANWPFFDGDLDAIIKQQMAEKQDLSGPKISIKKASAPILTAGAVSDISYQLLMRSSPSYLDAYTRIMNTAWARYTEAVFERFLAANGTDAGPLDLSGRDAFSASLFALASQLSDATGDDTTVVGVSSDLWLELGGMGWPNPAYGTQNTGGTASAATLRINVNGLDVTRWPFLDDGTAVFTNGTAARFAESGPYTATAEDVRKLGRDVAVWGMYEEGEIYFPTGVLVATATGNRAAAAGVQTVATRKAAK